MASSDYTQLDLSDPDVLRMAQENHTPEEEWFGNGTLCGVFCSMCKNAWPCDTAQRIREHDRLAMQKTAEIMRQGYRV